MKVALVPLNPIVGDFSGNLEKVWKGIEQAERSQANIAILPELALIGYPPQDLVLRTSYPGFAAKQLAQLAERVSGLRKDFAVVVGTALSSPPKSAQPLINAAVFLSAGRQEIRAKSLIPHYDIFHERRYFESAFALPDSYRAPIEFLGKKFGILICEDSWDDIVKYGHKLYFNSPSRDLVENGAQFLVNISASPFSVDKRFRRHEVIQKSAKECAVPIAYVNQIGGNDEIIFDGDSFIANSRGEIVHIAANFSPEILVADIFQEVKHPPESKSPNNHMEVLHKALLTGIRDYVEKNSFKTVLVGLSGGIDSALVATLAADALGPDRVFGFTLPSKFSSSHSISDAEALALNLGIHCQNFSIKFLQGALDMALKPYFSGKVEDVTEENLQARLRGVVLMAMANKFGHLLLATGNKSELAVGYSTLYGDMCGGLAPIGDLYKTRVYELARYLNSQRERIPQNSLEKAPSAELRPNQTDQDTLPPYEVLDRILHHLVEEEMSFAECESAFSQFGFRVKGAVIRDIERRLWQNDFKRNQYCTILRVSNKAFGIGRRYPLTKRIAEL